MNGRLYLKLNRENIGFIEYDMKEDRFRLRLDDKTLKLSPFVFDNGDSGAVKRFLMNLLPEGKGLDDLSAMMHIFKGNVFGLIKAIGAETAGALSFHAAPDETEETAFREISQEELRERIRERRGTPITLWDGKVRLSVAGVQEKLPVLITPDGRFGFGEGKLASTHILKFCRYADEHVVLNEHLCMTFARRLNLPAAETEILRFDEPVLNVKRFDRILMEDRVERNHIIDGCQMLDMPPFYKYERVYGDGRDVQNFREGVSLAKLFRTAELCSVPAAAVRDMLNWVLFNLLIGNCDAHGKNISWRYSSDKISVAPFYDMLSITVYKGKYNESLAIGIGDTFSPEIYAYDLAEMCETCGIQPRFAARMMEKLAKSVKTEIGDLTAGMELSDDESDFAYELISLLKRNAERYIEVAKELPEVK